MFLYTIKSWEEIFEAGEDGSGDAWGPGDAWGLSATGGKGIGAGEIEIKQQGRSFLVQPLPGGQMKINRIISTDPRDYLNPDWQPGSVISIR